MAYISQEEKKQIAPAVKAILKQFGLKGSLSVRHHSTLVLTIKEGSIDFIGQVNKARKERAEQEGFEFFEAKGHIDVNLYHLNTSYEGASLECIEKLEAAMKGEGWFDKSDSMTDYFHVKHYVDINVGKWNKPYILTK